MAQQVKALTSKPDGRSHSCEDLRLRREMEKPGDTVEETHNTNKITTELIRKARALDMEET